MEIQELYDWVIYLPKLSYYLKYANPVLDYTCANKIAQLIHDPNTIVHFNQMDQFRIVIGADALGLVKIENNYVIFNTNIRYPSDSIFTRKCLKYSQEDLNKLIEG